MQQEVSFAVNCADTRLGFHVRVVGSCRALGMWDPPSGLPLHTSASQFPTWHSEGATALAKDEVIEYKYVICDNSGRPERWEERGNRSMHLASLAAKGLGINGGRISVHEAFNGACESDETRFRSAGSSCTVRRTSSPTGRMASKQAVVPELHLTPKPEEQAEDLFAPTVRERRPSMSLLSEQPGQVSARRSASKSMLGSADGQAQHLTSALRSASKSVLGDLDGQDANGALVPEVTPCAPESPEQQPDEEMAAEARPLGGLGAAKNGLVREESCSNLFIDASEMETMKDVSEFEDRYSLVGNGPLGEGTFGLVWRCVPKKVDPVDRGAGAVKEMAAKIVRKARLQPRDMRYLLGEDGEVRTHLTMKHPHIVELHEYFDEPSTVTLVLEYCRGGDLFDSIVKQAKAKGRGFLEPAAAIVTQHVLSALEYVHSHSVVHRDIKCENVLLTYLDVPVERNVFKLCDFGFAAHDRGQGLTDRLGSPDTVAPEVVVGTPYSTPADLWSTGVLIYMMLSATPPFYATTDSEVLRKVRTGSYSLSGGVWDSISVAPKNMIAALMTVNARLRPTARDALSSEWLRDLPPAVDQ